MPVPALYQDGKTTARAAEDYLVANLTNSQHAEIARVYGYTSRAPARHPGVGIDCALGIRSRDGHRGRSANGTSSPASAGNRAPAKGASQRWLLG